MEELSYSVVQCYYNVGAEYDASLFQYLLPALQDEQALDMMGQERSKANFEHAKIRVYSALLIIMSMALKHLLWPHSNTYKFPQAGR